ncbi:DUF481 domain-containing protein [Thalassotalea sp. M1531]|uniref:DUF481 domain-containing protein n=1 Tax=Thalassotalea algicola TaxID=2716224 RepID=A0A7Y0Q8K8_9GAMM|nr:DUF481 domain-containing protein [Thalassotalea algicola]NMP33002.1 DUF481 domain-containing protein [Thalassotalea algicola]
MKNKLIAATISSLLLSAASFAEESAETAKHEYNASAELGFLYKTGNSKSGDVKTGFDFEHKYAQWTSKLVANLLYRKTEVEVTEEDGSTSDEFETSDQKLTINGQTNYTIEADGANYIYGSFGYTDDRFSSFDYQTQASAGWGKRWHNNDVWEFTSDIGPGFKRDRLSATDTQKSENNDAFIIQAQAAYKRKLNEHVELKQLVRMTQAFESDDNSVYIAETSVTTKLIEELAMKFSFRVEHNTEVDEGKDNTDTQTAITLVYSF